MPTSVEHQNIFEQTFKAIAEHYKEIESPKELTEQYHKDYEARIENKQLTELEEKYHERKDYEKLVKNYVTFYPYKDPVKPQENRIQPVISSISNYIEELSSKAAATEEDKYFLKLFEMVTAFNAIRSMLDKYTVESMEEAKTIEQAPDGIYLDINTFKDGISSYDAMFLTNIKLFEDAVNDIHAYEKSKELPSIDFSDIINSFEKMRKEALKDLVFEIGEKIQNKQELEYTFNFEMNEIKFGEELSKFGETITKIIKSHQDYLSEDDIKIMKNFYEQLRIINDTDKNLITKKKALLEEIKKTYIENKNHLVLGKILVVAQDKSLGLMGPQDEPLYIDSPKYRKKIIDSISKTGKSIGKHLSNTKKSAFGENDVSEKNGELKSDSKKSRKNFLLKFMSIKSDKTKIEEGGAKNVKPSKKKPRNN